MLFRSLFAPLGFLAVATGLTVWWGTRRGLSPIHKLSTELSQRSLSNLAPLDEPLLVEELRPLVHSLNDLFGRLSAAQDEQAQFIADAAHQLRTPLAGLSMTLELASKGTEVERAARIAQAKLATQRTIHLAQQLLTLSAVQSSTTTNDYFTVFELPELIQELAPNWAVKAEVCGVECNFSLRSCRAFGQRTMIGEAISNLVDNALVYCPAGSQVTIACGQEAVGGTSYFEVIDNGPGIDPKYLDRVFDRFFRAPDSVGTGSGLGLAIVQAVAQKNQLSVQFSKVEPHGLQAKLIFNAGL